MRTLKQLENLAGKRVLVRVDFNVPLSNGEIADDARITAALPTIEYLLAQNARLVLVSHLGRPKGVVTPELSLAPVAKHLSELLGRKVALAPAVVGPEVKALVDSSQPGDVVLLENVRFEPGETENSQQLSQQLAELADVYVNDAFGAAHRAHASTEGVAHLVKQRAAGLLLQREVETLGGLFADPPRPLVAVIGGAKVTDKIAVIDRFLEVADHILIGGAMCFPFLKAQGHTVGGSLCEEEGIEPAQRALATAASGGCEIHLPVDLVLGREFSAETEVKELDGLDVPDGWMGLDVGPKTAAAYSATVKAAGATFWNGPMGAFELKPFEAGTRAVAEAIAAAEGVTVVGGGDSAAALKLFGLQDEVTHLSTGGGASLELIEGKQLPGVEVLR